MHNEGEGRRRKKKGGEGRRRKNKEGRRKKKDEEGRRKEEVHSTHSIRNRTYHTRSPSFSELTSWMVLVYISVLEVLASQTSGGLVLKESSTSFDL